MEGEAKLDKVTSLLLGHTGWITGLVGKGENPESSMPISHFYAKGVALTAAVSDVAPCQFDWVFSKQVASEQLCYSQEPKYFWDEMECIL
eukprot:13821278-Ditylum_brightwellii.AAC.1